ncbi:MAG: TetR/AcrR family transcriptional regulator [Deltaproteobacteria bacterium]|nr:TetR/AcrR family transcriptional regulator [Deltaproteobacteria bacterium]MBI3295527.1 TetR/AcrR family transcriptional regulator [Deltaproteobacteria bacterium]
MIEKAKKIPTQDRSRTLFNTILESAARILPALGYTGATTNKIAEKAGVSIGSLYQYFSGKEAIFASLIERELGAHLAEVTALLMQEREKSFEEIVETLVDRTFCLFISKKGLMKELFMQAPRLDQMGEIIVARGKSIDLLAQLLVEKNHIDRETAQKKIFLCVHAFMGIIQIHSIIDKPVMSDEELKAQLTRMMRSYLTQ